MRIDVSELLQSTIGTQVDLDLNLGFQRLGGDVDVHSIQGTLNLLRTTEGIWVRGSLAVDMDLQCVRCLAPVSERIEIELDERFQTLPIAKSDKDQVYSIGIDHHIDLEPALRELIVVNTPMRVLCDQECKGICPTCGQNLNEGSCDCTPDDIDPRMAALKALLN
jgi:uncharacterized metal-binding protein YceD (DUF177 family)